MERLTFSPQERDDLINLITKYKVVMESKKLDEESLIDKKVQWRNITNEFNKIHTKRPLKNRQACVRRCMEEAKDVCQDQDFVLYPPLRQFDGVRTTYQLRKALDNMKTKKRKEKREAIELQELQFDGTRPRPRVTVSLDDLISSVGTEINKTLNVDPLESAVGESGKWYEVPSSPSAKDQGAIEASRSPSPSSSTSPQLELRTESTSEGPAESLTSAAGHQRSESQSLSREDALKMEVLARTERFKELSRIDKEFHENRTKQDREIFQQTLLNLKNRLNQDNAIFQQTMRNLKDFNRRAEEKYQYEKSKRLPK